MYTFAGVPQNVVCQSIVLGDSLSFGQFDLLKSKISIRVDGGGGGGLSSDQSELYLSHGLVWYQGFSINYTMIREKSV